MRIYYGAGHEMFPPDALLRHVRLAAEAGFDGICCSDHFQPWWEPGESGHAWPWLGAVGATVPDKELGTAVTPAVARYHPALVAQAFATLEVLFPGRVFLGFGSGESLNESPFGLDWASGEEQLERMAEALELIRRLWDGETIASGTEHYPTKDAKLHTRPAEPPRLYVSAFHQGAAEVAAQFGDGLWTLGDPEIAPGVIDAYRTNGGKGELILQALISWAETDEQALEGARVWKGAQPPQYYVDDWHDPQAMYENAERQMSDDQYTKKAIISADPAEHVQKLRQLKEMGATAIAVMNCSGADPEGAIRTYGEHVLSELR
jgi:coenzyme F420-dependent glucose-6-phosphate dehydrogenase